MRCFLAGVHRCISRRGATHGRSTTLYTTQRWFRVIGPMGRSIQPSSSSAAAAASEQQRGRTDGAGPSEAPAAGAQQQQEQQPLGVSVDITRDNFWAMLPLVKEALERCTFFAFDLEMTGLFLADNRHQYLDDFEERYAKIAASAASFQITQFGLSCFEPAAATPQDSNAAAPNTTRSSTGTTTTSGSSGGGAWAARTFNFWVFPSPGRHTAAPTFVCEASSMAFLSSQGFDFNTWVAQGVPYLPATLRDSLLQRVQSRSPSVSPDNGEGAAVLGQASDSDRELLAGVLTQVEAWLAAGDAAEHQQQQEEEETEQQQQQQAMNGSTSKEGPSQHNGTPAEVNGSQQQAAPSTQGAAAAGAGAGLSSPGNSSRLQQQQGGHQELLLPPMTSWQRLLVYHQLATAPWVADRGGHSGVWVSKADQGRWARLKVVRANAARAADLEVEDIARRRREVEEAAGFAAVMALLRDSGKPAVGHNLMFDLAYTLHSFATGSLPPSWGEFKALAQAWFPGGLYDTKYIASQANKPFPSTALGDLYQHLYFNTSSSNGYRGGSNNNANRNANGGSSSGSGGFVPPCSVRHAPGYDKYASLAPGAAAHEAGYDAFMTGACFAALAHQRAAGNSQVPGTATAAAATGGGAVTDSAQTPGVNGSAAAGAGSQGTDPAPPPPPAAAVTEAGAEVIRVLQPFVGRVPLGRSDIPYASLFGVDVVPDRPRVFFVEGLPLDLPFGVLNRALAPALQATQVMVTPVRTRGGLLVELDSTAAAAALQQRLADSPEGSLTAPVQMDGAALQITIHPWKRTAAALEGRGQVTPAKRKAEAAAGAEAAAAQRRRLKAAEAAAEEEEGDRRKGLCCIM